MSRTSRRILCMIPVIDVLSRISAFQQLPWLLVRGFPRPSLSTPHVMPSRCSQGSFKARSMSAVSMESIDGDASEEDGADSMADSNPPPPKHHTITVCMVPPPSATSVWTTVTKARQDLRDPGLFRWPPHVNLLYPFVEVKGQEEIVGKLRNATKRCQPFQVSLDTLGTFGGNKRGVLWLYPRSYRSDNVPNESSSSPDDEPLVQLQAMLEEEFPTCTDQRKGGQGYNPHMTLSHFQSLAAAQSAQLQIECWWSDAIFDVEEVYLLQRKGDGGQFLRVATLSLGQNCPNNGIKLHDPPEPFPAMPTKEEDWVTEERMKLKARRNGSWKGRGRRRRQHSPKSEYRRRATTDTPEIIAAKRAERKAKRERLERERPEKEAMGDDR